MKGVIIMDSLGWMQIQHQINDTTQKQLAICFEMISKLSDEIVILQREVKLLKGTNNEEEIS